VIHCLVQQGKRSAAVDDPLEDPEESHPSEPGNVGNQNDDQTMVSYHQAMISHHQAMMAHHQTLQVLFQTLLDNIRAGKPHDQDWQNYHREVQIHHHLVVEHRRMLEERPGQQESE